MCAPHAHTHTRNTHNSHTHAHTSSAVGMQASLSTMVWAITRAIDFRPLKSKRLNTFGKCWRRRIVSVSSYESIGTFKRRWSSLEVVVLLSTLGEVEEGKGKWGRGGRGEREEKEVVEGGKEREERGGSQYAGGKEGKGGGGLEIMSIQHNLVVTAGHGVLQRCFSLSECIMGTAQGSVNVVYPSGVALECQVHK